MKNSEHDEHWIKCEKCDMDFEGWVEWEDHNNDLIRCLWLRGQYCE